MDFFSFHFFAPKFRKSNLGYETFFSNFQTMWFWLVVLSIMPGFMQAITRVEEKNCVIFLQLTNCVVTLKKKISLLVKLKLPIKLISAVLRDPGYDSLFSGWNWWWIFRSFIMHPLKAKNIVGSNNILLWVKVT